jgi:plastocyanin
MRRFGLIAGLVVVLATAVAGGRAAWLLRADTASAQAASAVTIDNFAFTPAELSITTGTTVTWTNAQGAPHTVTSDTGGQFDSGIFNQGQTFSHTFNDAGEFPYHCNVHPSMTAVVNVAAAAAPAAPEPTAAAAPAAPATPEPAGGSAITMDNIAFTPSEVTVAAGTIVTWTNAQAGVPHTTTADGGQWDSGRMETGATFSFMFSVPGDYAFFCAIHPARMRGVVHVTGDAPVAQQTLNVTELAFTPQEFTIPAGGTVTWNQSQDGVRHTITADTAGQFDSGVLTTGQSFTFTFNTPGEYAYHCEIHPARMRGVVKVVPAAERTLTITELAFNPAELDITPGTTVRWANAQEGARHTSTSTATPPVWNSDVMTTGQSFSFTFTTAGEFAYRCEIHPARMQGVVRVGGGAPAAPPPAPAATPPAAAPPAAPPVYTPTPTPTPPPPPTYGY